MIRERVSSGVGRAVVLTLALLQPACSFLFVKPPPEVPVESPPPYAGIDCSRRFTGPVMDSVAASTSLSMTLVALMGGALQSRCDDGDGSCSNDNGAAKVLLGTSLVAAGVFAASAIYGYRTVHACRVLQRRLAPAPWTPTTPTPGAYGPPPETGPWPP